MRFSPTNLFAHELPKSTSETPSVVVLHPPGPTLGMRIELSGDLVVVGSDIGNDVTLAIEGVSRHHARLIRDADGWRVEDLGSTNGTFVNDREISKRSLAHGDLIRLGSAIVKFLASNDLEAAYHEELYWLTIRDSLTGAHNRRYLAEFLERELAVARRRAQPLSVIAFDVDHFKQINDEGGHLAGDAVLREIGHRIRARTRREDLFARVGGDEFVGVLVQTDLDDAATFAESVRAAIAARPFVHDGKSFDVAITIGVVTLCDPWPNPAITPDQLIDLADKRLYDAKREGRNRVLAGRVR